MTERECENLQRSPMESSILGSPVCSDTKTCTSQSPTQDKYNVLALERQNLERYLNLIRSQCHKKTSPLKSHLSKSTDTPTCEIGNPDLPSGSSTQEEDMIETIDQHLCNDHRVVKLNCSPKISLEVKEQPKLPPAPLALKRPLQRRSTIILGDDCVQDFRQRSAKKCLGKENLLEPAFNKAESAKKARVSCGLQRKSIIKQKKKTGKKKIEFIPLSKEHLKRLIELAEGDCLQVLVTKFNLNIQRSEIQILLNFRWLNDVIINFYMNLLTERSEKRIGQLPSVYAMNTFFVPRLLQSGHAGVKRWTRKVDLFSKDIIPVPVHSNGVHWCMAIIHMRDKTILYYDSIGGGNQKVLDALEAYLREESLDKRKLSFDTSGFRIGNALNVPQQKNSRDCGVFACMFAEYLTRDAPITFSQDNIDYFRRKMALEISGGELWL
ncbi:sentrin-specific protease 1 [Drosophila elegans]|uniref:sentrin-specific protease 1 n=1 Tax=Drosophila elegans TaxID=30023 RepID=UPI0007E694CE|nr:sentrin-specific protease 1 [Drosophila elegans]